jgi:tRNA (guanine26-N2/guanine27-N2)-dimethyltransferase
MALDRDIAVAVARAYAGSTRPRRAWEMLAATGVRGLRILHEGGTLESMVLSERNPQALSVLASNVADYRDRGAEVVRCNAQRPIGLRTFGSVDLDPFGSPLPFLDAALAAVSDEGLLAVTATDLPVLAGANRAACARKYGAVPLHGRLGPEGGLRILLATVALAARRTGRRIVPRVAYVLGHHLRCYLTASAKELERTDPVAPIVRSEWTGPSLPTGATFGPMWQGPLFDPSFVQRLEAPSTAAEPGGLTRLLDRWKEESSVGAVLFYEPNEVAGALHLASPPALSPMLEELRRAGFLAARSHVRPSAFRTTAPRTVVEAAARSVTGS